MERIQNMEYSLLAVQSVFKLLERESWLLPDICYECDYDFLDTHNYIVAVKELLPNPELKRTLQKHLEITKSIVCKKLDTEKTAIDRLYCCFYKSTSSPLREVYRMGKTEEFHPPDYEWFTTIKTDWTELFPNYPKGSFICWDGSFIRKEELYDRVDGLMKKLEFLLGSEKTDNTQPTGITDIIPKSVWNNLEAEGLITINPLTWQKTKALLAYFIEVACDKFNLKHGEKRQIQPFEAMFNVTGITNAINDYKKTGILPVGYKIIDNILK